MSMRDKIAKIVHEHETSGVDHCSAADAIIEALPDYPAQQTRITELEAALSWYGELHSGVADAASQPDLADAQTGELNLAGWIERRKSDVGPYADHIIKSVRAYEVEIEKAREAYKAGAASQGEKEALRKARFDALHEAANIADGYGSCACDTDMRDAILALIAKGPCG